MCTTHCTTIIQKVKIAKSQRGASLVFLNWITKTLRAYLEKTMSPGQYIFSVLKLNIIVVVSLWFTQTCLFYRLNHLVNFQSVLKKIAYDAMWVDSRNSSCLIKHPTALLQHIFSQNKVLSGLVFTSLSPFVCTWRKCRKVLMANSIQYQTLKSRYIFRGKRVIKCTSNNWNIVMFLYLSHVSETQSLQLYLFL